MDLSEIADALVAGCRTGKAADNLEALYAPDAVSVEATDMGNGRETKGIEGIKGKHAWWEENFEMHAVEISDPMLHPPNRFAVIFAIDATNKATGERSEMKEVALYTVADGKIVREEFFY